MAVRLVKNTYQAFLTEELFPKCGELNGHDAYFPAGVAATYGGAERAPEYLVTEADADDADAGLG